MSHKPFHIREAEQAAANSKNEQILLSIEFARFMKNPSILDVNLTCSRPTTYSCWETLHGDNVHLKKKKTTVHLCAIPVNPIKKKEAHKNPPPVLCPNEIFQPQRWNETQNLSAGVFASDVKWNHFTLKGMGPAFCVWSSSIAEIS